MKKQVTFYELTQVQFIMGFIKNINDTIDPLMQRFMLVIRVGAAYGINFIASS